MSVPYLPLEAWNKHWKVDGSRVRCRLCNHVQDLTQAGAFTHAPHCKVRTVGPQYPSRELAMLLQQKIQAGLY